MSGGAATLASVNKAGSADFEHSCLPRTALAPSDRAAPRKFVADNRSRFRRLASETIALKAERMFGVGFHSGSQCHLNGLWQCQVRPPRPETAGEPRVKGSGLIENHDVQIAGRVRVRVCPLTRKARFECLAMSRSRITERNRQSPRA